MLLDWKAIIVNIFTSKHLENLKPEILVSQLAMVLFCYLFTRLLDKHIKNIVEFY